MRAEKKSKTDSYSIKVFPKESQAILIAWLYKILLLSFDQKFVLKFLSLEKLLP